jgi:rapamycin-insensitive companion of mTOR
MAAPDDGSGYSVTPTQRVAFKHASRKSDDFSSTWQRPSTKSNRSLSGGTSHFGQPPTAKAIAGTGPPGSFSTDLRSALHSRSTTPQNDSSNQQPAPRPSFQNARSGDWADSSESRQAFVRDQIAKEMKIKMGTENMLEALMSKNAKQSKDQRLKIEQELGTSNRKLAELRLQLDQEIQRAQTPSTPPKERLSSYFRGSPLRSPPLGETGGDDPMDRTDEESPTVVLTDTLQALEIEGMQPDYYIERANILVELFKKHPTLKYDLAWSVFSLRVQLMLLSDSSDVVAAGYRLTRHAITDRASLRTIRSLHTDDLVILSLIKKEKAALEREQAVKLVRAFLDVKNGVYEISIAVARSLVSVAEHNDDTLKDICLLTLAEILTKHPSLLVTANGMSTLTDALANGTFPAPDGLVASFLHILDHPRQRRFLSTGREFEAMFAPFTDPIFLNGNEDKLKHCAKAIAAMLKTWPGFLALAERNANSLRSLIDSLQYPITPARGIILDLLIDTLRIKVPFWSDTYVAGRRLTTYGRVNTTEATEPTLKRTTVDYDVRGRFDLTYHFSAIVLAVLIQAGLIPALFGVVKTEEDGALRRRATLVLTEVLRMAQDSLPSFLSANIQVLGGLLAPVEDLLSENHSSNMEMLYQIDSINRTKNRAKRSITAEGTAADELTGGGRSNKRLKYSPLIDGEQFRQLIVESQVLNHTSYIKWKWDIILGLIEGPLTNPKRLEEAIKSSKFLKRVTGFYRPFKHRFSDVRNNQFNQRYVRYGCSLIRTLLQTQLGIQFLAEGKLLRQIAECLAQVDPLSGLTSTAPHFDRYQMTETLSGGYFAMLGSLSSTTEGVQIMERWHIMDMFYHILDRRDRDDLLKAILGNMDYSLDTHLRVMLSQALTSAYKDIRLFSTKLLRRHAVGRMHESSSIPDTSSAHWALKLVMTQLYDPDVEVCQTAVKILEEACEQQEHLEFVVKCRPALDHLGEIGAPLLLRFLATSVGYRYLNGLDYITQEMDDWFLGRNDTYVALVEASLARAYMDQMIHRTTYSDDPDIVELGLAPAHFYRELARTDEGCKLLRQSGHLYEFSSTIRDFDLEDDDFETLVKVKGSLWAIGNIGSMELGAPFLEEDDVVKTMVKIAEGAAVMSVRGTACFALGLCSRTTHGIQMLAENGWDTTIDSRGQSLGLCVPRDLERLCMVRSFYARCETRN